MNSEAMPSDPNLYCPAMTKVCYYCELYMVVRLCLC